jgi:hypothetical protein
VTTVAPPPDILLRLGIGHCAARILVAAIELDLFSALAEGPLEGEALRAKAGLDPRGAKRFFDALVGLGLLARKGARYRNTPETDFYLDRAKPTFAGTIYTGSDWGPLAGWEHLAETLRTGQPLAGARDLAARFDWDYADAGRRELFLREMTAVSTVSGRAIATDFLWSQYRSVVDIGCAQGGVLATILRAHPHLDGIGFDLPQVGPIFAAYMAQQGVESRARFVAGDFFAGPMPGAEVLLMGHILHDWDLAERKTLIAKAFAALPAGGALIVFDLMLDDDRPDNWLAAIASLNMLMKSPGGSEYPVADCLAWLGEAGFREATAQPLVGGHTMAIGRKV